MNLAAALVQITSLEAAQAAAQGRADKQRALDEKAVTMIRDYRKRFPTNLTFLQAECDLVARGGDLTRAIAITEEIDKISKSSTMGPMLRARIYARQEKTREVARAYGESLARNPRQPDVRVLLAQELIKLGEFDAALEQTKLVLDTDKDRPDAILLEARALAESGASDAEKEASRQSAVARLESAIAAAPAFLDAYHELAEIELKRGRRPAAIQALERDLEGESAGQHRGGQARRTACRPGTWRREPQPARYRGGQTRGGRSRRPRHQGLPRSSPPPSAFTRPASSTLPCRSRRRPP